MIQAPHKRNVTSRKRSGCVTCRSRRLRCDEGKPSCSNCTRLGIQCGGYVTRFRFKDQTDLTKNKLGGNNHEERSPSTANASLPLPSPPAVRAPDAAVLTLSLPLSDNIQPSSSARPPPSPGIQTPSPTVTSVENTGAVSTENTEISEHGRTDLDAQQQVLYDAAASLSLIAGIWPSTPAAVPPQPDPIDNRTLEHTDGRNTLSLQNTNFEDAELLIPAEEQGDDPCPQSVPHSAPHEPAGIENPAPVRDSVQAVQISTPQTEIDWVVSPVACQELASLSIAPPGLLEAAKFAQDMIYYHHLCDTSPHGLLSVLGLSDILRIDGLDKGFFHAALALSALHISQVDASGPFSDTASFHALDHFVEALSSMRAAHPSGDVATIEGPSRGQGTTAWLVTLLLLANFELNRGQMKLWYVHSQAAVLYLSQNVNRVGELPMGESIVRSFSRIAALLDIFDRSYTACHSIAVLNLSSMLSTSLRTSPDPSDRLLYILPRVGAFEEELRSSPQLDDHWRLQAQSLIDELKAWRRSLDNRDVPSLDEVQADPWSVNEGSSTSTIRPLTLNRAENPVKAATNFMHYLLSLVRLETRYRPGTGRQLPANGNKLILVACRLAAGVSSSSCAAINAYGHGMVPALMNAYYSSEDGAVKAWIKDWISRFPHDREGIWNVRHAHRLLQYVDGEYTQRGSRANWEVIRVRMVDLDEDKMTEDDDHEADRFSVEIYSRCKRGWSLDFVDVP